MAEIVATLWGVSDFMTVFFDSNFTLHIEILILQSKPNSFPSLLNMIG